MASESVRVIVRCRPINKREKDLCCKVIIQIDTTCGQCSITNPCDNSAPPKTFTFDGAYFTNATTEQIYNEIVYPIVEGVTEGYNGTVFAYGQTGCGKSFTMQGIPDPSCQRGIIPRSFEHIFEAIATSENMKYLVHASYLEIYNEEIRDLLGKDCKKKLELKEHPDRGVYVTDLSLHPVHNVHECEEIMDRGWKNRSVGATLMNADSSRSHSIFTIHMEMLSTDQEQDQHIRKGKLNLVDLAGSERQAKTGATGDRLKEATKINLSLSALGNVISALVDGKSKHIPYRDSKLTRLLQDSLGGNTKTLMVACISPADNNYDETLSTLRYANRAKNIQNKPKINEDPKDALLREYQQEIERLKAMLNGQPEPEVVAKKKEEEEERVEKLRREYDEKMKELMLKYRQEQESNARLQNDVTHLKASYEDALSRVTNKRSVSAEAEKPTTSHFASAPVSRSETNDVVEPEIETIEVTENTSEKNADCQAQALERLHELEQKIVGGEKVHDNELKEKRAKRKSFAEKRMSLLKEALSKLDDDDKAMLKVYDDIHEELKAKTTLVKRAKKKIVALEREITDLQSEFEADRTDYLETIRRQDQQVKLLQQILDKIQPCLRRDCNYSNIDRIKLESKWDEDHQKWNMPELIIMRTKLPPTGIQPGGRVLPSACQSGVSFSGYFDESCEDKFLQMQLHPSLMMDAVASENITTRLEKSEQEDIAGTYFKPRRQEQLLNSVHKDNSQQFYTAGFSDGTVRREPLDNNFFQTSFNGNLSNSLPSNLGPNINGGSSVVQDRKPPRLESLNVANDFIKKIKKKSKPNTGSMEWPI